MDITIQPGPLSGKLPAISSKSHAHRLLIATALAHLQAGAAVPPEGTFGVKIFGASEDISATCSCLRELWEEYPALDCGESGSTLRFLLPITMALKETAVFLGKGRLPQRPMEVLKDQMEQNGCYFLQHCQSEATESVKICTVSGCLQPGDFFIPGNISSQYITGLLFALPLLSADSRIVVTGSLESSGYVDLTLEVLQQFGIRWELREPFVFHIPGNQQYKLPTETLFAEGDWSNTAFWLAAGALSFNSGKPDAGITCTGLNSCSQQGDRGIIQLLGDFGATVFAQAAYIGSSRYNPGLCDYTAEPGTLGSKQEASCHSIVIDAAEIPDLVPILSVLACGFSGRTEIINAGRLRIKESDRLSSVTDCLTQLGGKIEELPEGLIISGTGALTGGTVSSYNDHRIAMSMAVASILCTTPVTILDAGAVNKSYPGFWEDFKILGGRFTI